MSDRIGGDERRPARRGRRAGGPVRSPRATPSPPPSSAHARSSRAAPRAAFSDATGSPAEGAPERASALVLRAARLRFVEAASRSRSTCPAPSSQSAYLGDIFESDVETASGRVRVLTPSETPPPPVGHRLPRRGPARAAQLHHLTSEPGAKTPCPSPAAPSAGSSSERAPSHPSTSSAAPSRSPSPATSWSSASGAARRSASSRNTSRSRWSTKYGCKVAYVLGGTPERRARAYAERGRPSFDVIYLNIFESRQAVKDGVTQAPTDAVPQFANLYESPSSAATASRFNPCTIVYDKRKASKPVTSWKDIWNPEWKGRIAWPSYPGAEGTAGLLMAAKVWGGDENEHRHRLREDQGAQALRGDPGQPGPALPDVRPGRRRPVDRVRQLHAQVCRDAQPEHRDRQPVEEARRSP